MKFESAKFLMGAVNRPGDPLRAFEVTLDCRIGRVELARLGEQGHSAPDSASVQLLKPTRPQLRRPGRIQDKFR